MPLKTQIQSAKETAQKNAELGWGDIKVLSHTYDDWEVELFIPLDEITEDALPQKLKNVKDMISTRYEIPSYALQYQNIIQKEVTETGVITSLRIKRVFLEKGRPKFNYQTGIAPSGTPYSDMACYADICLLDEFEKELTIERFLSLIYAEGIPDELIDYKAVDAALKELKESGKPMFGVRVGQGIFPDSGKDAEVEFYFHANPSAENAEEYVSSRKVARNDLLCSKSSPTEGKSAGKSVHGRVIPARRGFDISLEPGKNTRADMEHTKLFADLDGLAIVRREERSFMTPAGVKMVPSKVMVRVDPLRIIEVKEDEVIDITTRDSVEIRGTLKVGSRIISSGEVHVEGNISQNSVIQAADDVFISGSVNQSALYSDKNIIAAGNVKGSRISASGTVVVKGEAINSTVVGRDIHIDQLRGGSITAAQSLTVNELGSDENGVTAAICIAAKDFLQNKINENNDFLAAAQANLSKLTILFGEDIAREVIPQNVQQQLLKFVSNLKKDGIMHVSQVQMETYKKLLTSIEPLRRLILEKELENVRLQKQLRQSSADKRLVVVKERITAKTKVSIESRDYVLDPKEGKTELSVSK